MVNQQRGRELLMRILEVFVLKFRSISKHVLPSLLTKCKSYLEVFPNSSGSSSNAGGAAGAGFGLALMAPSTSANRGRSQERGDSGDKNNQVCFFCFIRL